MLLWVAWVCAAAELPCVALKPALLVHTYALQRSSTWVPAGCPWARSVINIALHYPSPQTHKHSSTWARAGCPWARSPTRIPLNLTFNTPPHTPAQHTSQFNVGASWVPLGAQPQEDSDGDEEEQEAQDLRGVITPTLRAVALRTHAAPTAVLPG